MHSRNTLIRERVESRIVTMRLRATNLLLLFDYVIGMTFALAILAFGGVGFALTGMPTSYEKRMLGNVYAEFLARVETSARGLRKDFCANTDAITRAQSNCPQRSADAQADTAESAA
jgi:hypothetical protein